MEPEQKTDKKPRQSHPLPERLKRLSPEKFKAALAEHKGEVAAFTAEIERRKAEAESL